MGALSAMGLAALVAGTSVALRAALRKRLCIEEGCCA